MKFMNFYLNIRIKKMEKVSKKLFPSSCLFCVNSSTSVRKFKITEDYGGGNTIRYDLTSFLGHQIEPYLKDDDLLCSNCMNFFENMAYTKRRLIDFLRNRDESEDIKMQGFNDIWKGFKKFAVNLVKFNPDESEENWDSSDIRRSITPNPLVHAYSEPYNQAYERELSEIERAKSRSGFWEANSETDLEVSSILTKRGRRRKRGHNWTRRRGEQKSRALSRTYPAIYDSYERNCYTSMTNISQSSSVRSDKSSKTTASRRKKKVVEGKPVRTRSVSRLENYLANVIGERESNKYYCEDINCSLFFEKIENYVLHKRYDHNIIARFPCHQCRFKGTTKRELEIHHSKLHDKEIIMCFQCRAEIQGTYNLQEHLKQHQEYSIGCKFCYLNFLSKTDLVEHMKKDHQGKRRKKIHEKPSFVFQKLVNYEKMSKEPTTHTNNNEPTTKDNMFRSIILQVEKSPSPNPLSRTTEEKTETVINEHLVLDDEIEKSNEVNIRTDNEINVMDPQEAENHTEHVFEEVQNFAHLKLSELQKLQLFELDTVVNLERLELTKLNPNP